jgi:hypothetical protein
MAPFEARGFPILWIKLTKPQRSHKIVKLPVDK